MKGKIDRFYPAMSGFAKVREAVHALRSVEFRCVYQVYDENMLFERWTVVDKNNGKSIHFAVEHFPESNGFGAFSVYHPASHENTIDSESIAIINRLTVDGR